MLILAHLSNTLFQKEKIAVDAGTLDQAIFRGALGVVVELTKVNDDYQLTLDDLTCLRRDDRSLQQFLEIATSQHAFMNP